MKVIIKIILALLVLLAGSSGLTKIMLMQQDVEFFGKYGFSNPILMSFGAFQLLGGILLILPKTRILGAIIVAITFLISAVVLYKDGNFPVVIVTLICVGLLGLIAAKSRQNNERN